MGMKFKSREGWGGDAEVFDAAQKVHRHFSPKTLVTVHDYRTKQGRAVLKIVKAAPLLLDALRQWAAAERDGDAAELANARIARDAAIAAATN